MGKLFFRWLSSTSFKKKVLCDNVPAIEEPDISHILTRFTLKGNSNMRVYVLCRPTACMNGPSKMLS